MSKLPIQDGLIWSDQIMFTEEGPFTVAAKVATLNSITPKNLMPRVFGPSLGKLLSRHSSLSTSDRRYWDRSSLTRFWKVSVDRFPVPTSVGREILMRTLASQLGEFASLISGSQRLRYCHQCLETGFQSELHQVSAIVRCPIHRCELLEICRHCSAPTPPYTVFSAFKHKLKCHACAKPLSPAWDPEGHVVGWAPPAGQEVFTEFKRQLQGLQRIVFDGQDGFDKHFSMLPDECRRIAHFAVAHAVLAPELPAEVFDPRAMRAQPLVVHAKPAREESRLGVPRSELKSAYLALNEMLACSIGEQRLNQFMHAPGQSDARGVHGSLADVDDAESLAFALWRTRSDEGRAHLGSEPERIRLSYVLNIQFHDLSLIDWMKVLILAFDAERRLATAWCQRLAALEGDPDAIRRLGEQFSGFFQLSYSPSPPAVTKVGILSSPRHYHYEECDLAIWDASTVFPIPPLAKIESAE